MKHGKIFLALLTAGSVLAISGFLIKNENKDLNPEAAVYVDGLPVTVEELNFAVRNCRSDVITYFYNTYGALQEDDFWETDFEGETPRKRLLDTAVERAIRIKTEQLLMQDYDIVSDISYETFEKELSKENRRRKDAVKQKQILYGPEQYTADGYFEYLHNNRILKLNAALNAKASDAENPKLDYSDTLFDEAYQKKRSDISVNINDSVVNKLVIE